MFTTPERRDSLTEYEQKRKPQEISIDSEIALSPRSLYRELICPICHHTLDQTRAAPDCLHRFCKKCLDKSLKKEWMCPLCGKRLPSTIGSFRKDPNFDRLIARIFYGPGAAKVTESSKATEPLEYEVILKHLHGQQRRYIKCPANTTVDHLTRYLAIRPDGVKMPDLDNNVQYKLCIVADRSQGEYKMLEQGSLKLEEIKTLYNLESNKPFELYFYNPTSRIEC